MKVTHTLEITAICPVDGKPDVYLCKVEATRVVEVEKIIAKSVEFNRSWIYQEDLCQELHRALACKVTLIGYHSGVRTEVTCGGAE